MQIMAKILNYLQALKVLSYVILDCLPQMGRELRSSGLLLSLKSAIPHPHFGTPYRFIV
jgi:hypothetical protein